MGTNFYWHTNRAEGFLPDGTTILLNVPDDIRHLGKRSSQYGKPCKFTWAKDPIDVLKTVWNCGEHTLVVVDEYGEHYTPGKFFDVIRQCGDWDLSYIDEEFC